MKQFKEFYHANIAWNQQDNIKPVTNVLERLFTEADIKKVGPKMSAVILKLAQMVGKKHMDYKDFIEMSKLLKTNWTKARKFYQPLDTMAREDIAMALKAAGFGTVAMDIFQIEFR